MRVVFPFTVALAIGLLVPGSVARQQDKAGSTEVNGQAAAPPAPSKSQTESGPVEQAPDPLATPPPPDTHPQPETKVPEPDKKAPESDAKGKTDSDSVTTNSTGGDSEKIDVGKTSPGKTDLERSDSTSDSTKTGSVAKDAAAASSSNGATKRTQRSTTPASGPRKIVVRKGGAKEPATQIAPGITPAEAARERQNAEQWLRTTGDQMQQLSILPDSSQQETVSQIRNYMLGARSALQEGDVRRASTLAEKARLLAEDLLKR
ncbi:MAG: hypothetical protein ABSG02_06145 [Terriglobales bacterium]|jgi:hypothetical protein